MASHGLRRASSPDTSGGAAWRFSVQFGHAWPVDAGSPLYRQGWCGLGGECASASNLHMVAMGALNLEDYRTLYDLMGDDYARQRYADLLQYATQQVARFDGDLGMPRGGSVESFWASDATAGKGFVTVYDFAGHMAWVIGWAALAICTHLLAHSSSQP